MRTRFEDGSRAIAKSTERTLMLLLKEAEVKELQKKQRRQQS
jgi:hypothetical protein